MSIGKGDLRHRIKNGNGPDQNLDKAKIRRKSKKGQEIFNIISNYGSNVALFIFLFAICIFCGYQYFIYYKTNLVRKPLDLPTISSEPKIGDINFWGTYRPQLFFGFKPRIEASILSGLLWFTQPRFARKPDIRYWCKNDGGIKKFGWEIHDGKRVGKQVIVDSHQKITTSFVKNEVSWISKINVKTSKDNIATSLMWYLYIPETTRGYAKPEIVDDKLSFISGQAVNIGEFKMTFKVSMKNRMKQNPHSSFLISHVPRDDKILDTIENGLGYIEKDRLIGLIGHANIPKGHYENIWVYEITAFGNFSLYITYETTNPIKNAPKSLSLETFQSYYDDNVKAFHDKFNKTFRYSSYNNKQIDLSKSVLSNLIGGIGYFYGQSLVLSSWMSSEKEKQPLLYWPAGLLSGTPSRTMFPRGFLWDEGFHAIVFAKWDPYLALDIVGHWLDLINAEGWIPREQILGWEARAKVPDEFVIQDSKNGNPPTLLFCLEDLNNRFNSLDKDFQEHFLEFLQKAIPRLEAWFNWLNTTQIGEGYSHYMWKGRIDNNNHLNALTLTSGFDDYPRSSHPTNSERHIDLRCWMGLFARVLAQLKTRINQDASLYSNWSTVLHSDTLLDSEYWDKDRGVYSDWGLHTESVKLVKRVIRRGNNPPGELVEEVVRVVDGKPYYMHVPHTGYISFFPLFLQILSQSSLKLDKLLDRLSQTNLLWTRYGLRSLATTSSLYRARNSQHDPPYWRGAIWINMNFLAVRSLKYYSKHNQKANNLYRELRYNLVNTILNNFDKTGYLWEQYDDSSGIGQRAHPFSGWTALVVLAMED